LIEGVMMRNRKHMVMCVRKPNKDIVTNIEKLNPLADKYRALGVPFVRGVVAMLESLYLGMKGIMFSGNVALDDGTETENPAGSQMFGNAQLAVIFAGAAGVVAVFLLVPFFLAAWLGLKGMIFATVEAVIRLAMFLAYLVFIASWSEFRRVLKYHGAEHKAINAYEAGAPMDVEHVKKYSRLHPRCGTSFLFIVVLISIVLFSLISNLAYVWMIAYRIALIPVIAGLSYELLRLSGKYRNNAVAKVLTAPGMGFQWLTTKEPSDDMLEVSIKAVQEVTKLN
jgi:uncharacterized protein YqhQ